MRLQDVVRAAQDRAGRRHGKDCHADERRSRDRRSVRRAADGQDRLEIIRAAVLAGEALPFLDAAVVAMVIRMDRIAVAAGEAADDVGPAVLPVGVDIQPDHGKQVPRRNQHRGNHSAPGPYAPILNHLGKDKKKKAHSSIPICGDVGKKCLYLYIMVDLMPKWRLLILFAVALASTWAIYGPTLRIALQKGIVDNPDARKLQKRPVPTLGGVVVFFGIAVGLMFFKTMFYQTALLPVLAAMVIMLYVGTIDDVVGIAPTKRLLIEVGVALLLIYGSRSCILNFQELWGLGLIPLGVAIPLTAFTIVGLVNAINMIDGVDGLLSGFGILICGFYGLLCFLAHDYSNAALAAVTAGALLTFFLHNVFGQKSKMFLGDGGSMLLGILVSWLVISILGGHFHILEYLDGRVNFNLIAFALAVVAIPVADTLRVMTVRVFEGRSPLQADNLHLHHHFLRCGFSHLATTLSMLGMALVIVGAFLAVWALGASADWQLYTVIAVTALLDGGGAWVMGRLEGRHVISDHPERKGLWRRIQERMDKGLE